jgi:hypothetical protein
MATRKDTKSALVAHAKQLIAGVAKHMTGVTQVPLAGASYTPAELTAKLNQVVQLRTDVDTAKAQAQAKLAAETADMPALRVLMDALMSYVKAAYGTKPDALADFGLSPKAKATPTVEAKAASAAKRASTRKARGTMGSKQKKSVKGDVVGITVTPITAAKPSVTAPSSPTPAATSGGTTAATAGTHTT